jgi:integrase
MRKTGFRLYKRLDNGREMSAGDAGYRDRPYYFRFTHRGKAYTRCLETNDKVEAQTRAKKKYEEIVSAVASDSYTRLDATKLRSTQTTTLEEIFAAYRTGPAQASAATRELNINALTQIVTLSAGGEVAAIKVTQLTPTLARKWFEVATTKALAEPDQQKAASLKRSANSRWIQAASLFTDRCLAHYQDLELLPAGPTGLAALAAFVRAGAMGKFTRIPKKNYNPPSDKIIQQTLRDWEALAQTPDPSTQTRDVFLAIGHELAFGLRIGELAQATWAWHTARNGYPVLDGRANVKGCTGLIQVRALDPFYSTLKRVALANNWWPDQSTINSDPSTPVISGTDNYRTDELYRHVGDWLRARGWETLKTNHALRAYAGSQVAMRYGIYEAQMWLRHSTVKVTEQNYSHFVAQFKPADLAAIPARWAVLPAIVQPPTPKVTGAEATLDETPNFHQPPSGSNKRFEIHHFSN